MYRSQYFIFDDVSSEEYGLMIYFIDDESVREVEYGTNVTVIEDRLTSRIDPIHYGVDMNQSFSFPLTFGSTDYLDNHDVELVLRWLTGHQDYKWLEFDDGDSNPVRYKCHINNVRVEHVNGIPFAFSADIECDSQFAYEYAHTYTYEDIPTSGKTFVIHNHSTYNGYLYPQLKITCTSGVNKITITNAEEDRAFEIDTANLGGLTVYVDNKNGIISHNGTGVKEALNLYPYFNMRFMRLLSGDNHINIKPTGGTCDVDVTCEFLRKAVGH